MALATAWWNRYKNDLFLRARLNVIALQIGFGIAVMVIFWIALRNAQENIAISIASGIADIVDTGGTVRGEDVLARIEATRQFEFLKIFLISIFVAGFFGYFISRATLLPAKNALAAQKRFISNIAHELRTPLSVIKTNTEVLLLDRSIDKEIVETLDDTVAEVDRASDIINNLLSLDSHLHPRRLEFREVDLSDVVDSAISKVASLARNKELEIVVKKRGEYRVVNGNRTALEQVTINLLKNSITHTSKDGRITVTTEPDYQGFITLSVRDSGSGIAREDLFHIFEPYYRAEASRNRATGGSGLGLTIVSEVVKAHQGKIGVHSVVGKGTTVTIKIPCSTPPAARVKKQADEPAPDEVVMDFSR